VVSSACAKRRLPERGWNLDAADTKERKVRSPPTGLEAGGPRGGLLVRRRLARADTGTDLRACYPGS